ncbi:TPA: hypothetical protein ACH3X2_005950 [Trebouxia sp. C0005]
MHNAIWQSALSLLGFKANQRSLSSKVGNGVQAITGDPVHTIQAYILKLESQNAVFKAALRRGCTTDGAVHAFSLERELNGVLRQLQQRDEQLRQKDASLVAAVQRCNCLMSDLALFQTKLHSKGESLASAKHQLLKMGTLLLQYKKAWELSHQQNQGVRGQLASFSAALQNRGATQTCYAPGALVQSLQPSPEPREPSPVPREPSSEPTQCLHAESPVVSSAAPTLSRPVATSVQHAAATEPSSSLGHLVHVTQPGAARLAYQRAAPGPALPKSLSRFSSNAASQSKPVSAPSRDRYDAVAVQRSVSPLQQTSSTPLHPTQSMSGASQAVQPISGYTIAAQPNMLGAYLATRIYLAMIL